MMCSSRKRQKTVLKRLNIYSDLFLILRNEIRTKSRTEVSKSVVPAPGAADSPPAGTLERRKELLLPRRLE